MSETCTIVRKVKLFPMGDKEEINRVYTYLREGIESQNRAMNQYMSALYMEMMQDMSKEDRKELNSFYQRISTSKKGSAYDETIEFAKGLPMGSSITQKVNADFKNAMKKGLQYGRISLPTYRDKNPLIIHRDYVRLLSTNPHLKNGIIITTKLWMNLKSIYIRMILKCLSSLQMILHSRLSLEILTSPENFAPCLKTL